MKETPILFSGEMVRAILDGRKTQTRRIMKEPWKIYIPKYVHGDWPIGHHAFIKPGIYPAEHNAYGAVSVVAKDGTYLGIKPDEFEWICPYGKPGDLLWVKETFSYIFIGSAITNRILYKADGTFIGKWRPSIFMPRWASRITLKITNVRVERLQEIGEDDAYDEGYPKIRQNQWKIKFPRPWFIEKWDSINAKPKAIKIDGVINHYVSYPFMGTNETRSYRGKPWYILPNPWVWVIEFNLIEGTGG